jgi:hypothetical protein
MCNFGDMSDLPHSPDDSQIDLAGYRACLNEWCGELVLKEVAERTRNYCPECWRKLFNSDLTEIEIRGRGFKTQMPLRTKTTPKRNKGNKGRSQQVEKAKIRAMKRLRAIFPDLYDMILAEERARAGLDPWPVEMAVRGSNDRDGEQTIEFAHMYHLLKQAGVEPDESQGNSKNNKL